MFAAFGTCAEPMIKVEKKPWGADYTLVSSDGNGDVTLVSVRPILRQVRLADCKGRGLVFVLKGTPVRC